VSAPALSHNAKSGLAAWHAGSSQTSAEAILRQRNMSANAVELRGAELCIAGLGVLVIGKMLGHTQAVTTAR
jgi:hypothetical protein